MLISLLDYSYKSYSSFFVVFALNFLVLVAVCCCTSYVAQGVPLANIIRPVDGEERFMTAVYTTGHKKDMPYFAGLIEQHIGNHVDLLVAYGACAGLLTIVEKKHSRYAAGDT